MTSIDEDMEEEVIYEKEQNQRANNGDIYDQQFVDQIRLECQKSKSLGLQDLNVIENCQIP